MKKIVSVIAVMLGILLLSAIVAPYIYQVMPYKYHRILSRLIMIQVIMLVVWYYRKIDASSFRSLIPNYGLAWQKGISRKQISQGIVCAYGILVILMVLEVFLGARIIHLTDKSSLSIAVRIVEYIFAAFIIGFIEEFFFRGMIYKKLRKISLLRAFVVTNVFYAIVHFFKAGEYAINEVPTFMD
ncbi:MAG: CPBP family intramembrane metalloprotease, partial [Candidatus Heimdallarchaeota archaeon]|nr:CPBP family intramembrane metalloprotease [Candidatus Heimdallarchaeota archaeon]